MSEDNMRMEPEYITVCEKCGSEYPVGTSYCTNPLCRANLAIYGKIVQKNASSEVDAACQKIEQMMEDVMSALSGKSFEAEKRPKFQDGFIRIIESTRTAKNNTSLQNYLQQAEQWKNACLTEITLLGENLEGVREQSKARITRARETVMSALAGKQKEQEKRKEYGAQYDAIWTKVNSSESRDGILECAIQAEYLMQQYLAEISRLGEEDPQYEAKLQSAKQQAQNRIDAAKEAVVEALSKKENGDQYINKYTTGFKNSSVRLQQCKTLEEVNDCAAQAEAIRDSNLREIQGMKDKPENSGTVGGTTGHGGTTGGTIDNGGTVGGTTDNGGTTGGTTDIGGSGGNTIDPQFEANLQRAKQEAQKRIDAAMGAVLKELSKKKKGDQHTYDYTMEFRYIGSRMQQCRTMNEVNACVVQAEELRDRDLQEIQKMKNKLGGGKVCLLILFVLLALIVLIMIGSGGSSGQNSASRGSGNTSAGTGNTSGSDDGNDDENNGDADSGDDADPGDDTEEETEVTAEPWEKNVLMSDIYDWESADEFFDWPVLGSDDWVRSDITAIVILDTLDSEAEDSWDVSEAQDGSVKAWVVESGSDTILYIAGEGGILAPKYSQTLFAGYGAETIEFGTAFHTDGVTSMGRMFDNCNNLEKLDLKNFDTSSVTVMRGMFRECSALQELDVSGFDTSNVTDMYAMFINCCNLNELDVSGFDTSNVTDMYAMFGKCSSLTELDVSGFNTSNVTNMAGMFEECSSLTELDVSGFDTSNVTDMYVMFINCCNLNELDVSGFNTSNVTNMCGMFQECSSLTELDVSSFDTSNVTDMSCMFYECDNLAVLDVSGFDTSNVTNMYTMFYNCGALNELDVSGFDTSNVTNMRSMFSGCSNITKLDLTGFDFANVSNTRYMFFGCSSLRTIGTAVFDFSNVAETTDMFYGCDSLDTTFLSGY